MGLDPRTPRWEGHLDLRSICPELVALLQGSGLRGPPSPQTALPLVPCVIYGSSGHTGPQVPTWGPLLARHPRGGSALVTAAGQPVFPPPLHAASAPPASPGQGCGLVS